VTESRTVTLLSPEHVDGLRALSAEPDVTAAAAMDGPLTPEEAARYVADAEKAREDGQSYVFVLTEGTSVSGICRLIGVRGVPRLIVAVGQAWRGRGNGSFLVRHVLAFAFDELELEQVTATGACLRLMAQFGLREGGDALTRQEWLAWRAEA
jgi:GNAT superfamily N-acetyltransferase